MLPDEPVEIGTEPQFFVDDYIVDNRWALRYKNQALTRVFHQSVKHESNPLISGEAGYVDVVRDPESGIFRAWYQTSYFVEDATASKGVKAVYAVAYAESTDGLNWELPRLGLYEWKGSKDNNIVWRGVDGQRASGPQILDLPESARRGCRYILAYRQTDGIHLVGSQDGIHWDASSDTRIAHLHSDTLNSIVYDGRRRQYVMYCRAKHLYRARTGDIIDVGASRRVARMASKELWTDWLLTAQPQNILIPDELDEAAGFNFFYGMPTVMHAGMYWGALWPFKMNTDIVTELAFSRDGIRFERLAGRPKLIELGPEGAWDDGMVFGGPGWVAVGDEWWLYYSGWDGPHESSERTGGIGLARVRKEGFVSMRGPRGGGVIVTRRLRWPGGGLLVNADATDGELRVRVSDAKRSVLPGFDYADCVPFKGNSVAHEITWKDGSLTSLADQVIRFEFLLTDADLYTFRAAGAGS